MGILARDNKQMIYIYSEDSSLGKRILPYVECMSKRVRVINLNKESISDTIWVEISSLLNTNFEDLFNIEKGKVALDTSRFCAGDWLKLINVNPSILFTPIIINGNKAKMVTKRSDIFQFYNPTGGSFDKAPSAIKYADHNPSPIINGSI